MPTSRHSASSIRRGAATAMGAVLASLPAASGGQVRLAQPADQSIVLVESAKEAGLGAQHAVVAASFPGTFKLHQVSGGIAVADFNRDGWDDIFWLSGGGTGPDKLFINQRNGTFADEAEAWGVARTHSGMGVTVADYNADGWPDLYVTTYGNPALTGEIGRHMLYRNNGDGTFAEVAVAAGVNFSSQTKAGAMGSAWGDYDLDGDLDLMVSQWEANAQGNRLYRNNGDGTFTDVTLASKLVAIGTVRGFQASFADMNGDLYPEILLIGDFVTSRYYINNGDGTFTNYTSQSGTGIDDNGMGHAVADFNNDGLLDWYVTSIRSDGPPLKIGNVLYMNLGDHLYAEVGKDAGVEKGWWGWGTVAADLDQDGWEDILAVNGWYSLQWKNHPPRVYRNLADGTFRDVAESAGVTQVPQGRGAARIDADNDGDLDLLISANQGALHYYRNDSAAGHWLQVVLDATNDSTTAPDGFGARVVAHAGGLTMQRFVDGATSFVSSSGPLVHFGLGDASVVDLLEVYWPNGIVTKRASVGADQRIVIAPSDLVLMPISSFAVRTGEHLAGTIGSLEDQDGDAVVVKSAFSAGGYVSEIWTLASAGTPLVNRVEGTVAVGSTVPGTKVRVSLYDWQTTLWTIYADFILNDGSTATVSFAAYSPLGHVRATDGAVRLKVRTWTTQGQGQHDASIDLVRLVAEVQDPETFPQGCPADCTGDGKADILDLLCFASLIAAADAAADCTADGQVNILDLLCVAGLVEAGCHQ
jgi:hypothetical protein